MSGSKLFNPAAFFFFLFIFLKPSLCSCFVHNASIIILCPEIEKRALLGLKETLEDPSNLLLSWSNGEANCCNFKGVVCGNLINGIGDHVLELRLRGFNLTGKLSSSLLNLTYLNHLDLSYNSFSGETIPSFFGSFKALEYLNLTYSHFHGIIPHTIGNLSNLRALSLRRESGLEVDSLEWLSGLDQLEHLNMNSVNLSRATNWIQLINKLPCLKELHLRDCSLNFLAPLDIVNISALSILDLSWNDIHSSIPGWFFQLSNLFRLDISANRFTGPIPNVSNTTKLQYIDLSYNRYINSTIPDWVYLSKDLVFVDFSANTLQDTVYSDIGNLSSLSYLDLSDNDFSGKLPREISGLNKMSLLDLSTNNLHGEIPYSFGNLSNLERMDLSGNQLGGALPTSLGKLLSLKELGVSFNNLSGNFPEWLGQLFNLESLYISDNMLRGVVNEKLFANLTNLKLFYASGNHLTLNVKPDWNPPFQLEFLRLRSWSLGPNPQIPTWLKTQRKMLYLDLSKIGLLGTIPNWIWNIQSVNLSQNSLHGNVPDIIGDGFPPYIISLSSNQLSGPLPRISDTIMGLDLSNNAFTGSLSHFLCGMANLSYGSLKSLLLNENKLSGKLPDCWMNFPSLSMLNLGNNNFSGSLPNSIGIPTLKSLTLHGNKFSGQIPSSLLNSTLIEKIDLGNNDLDGNIPTWMGASLPNLRILILQSNKLSSGIPLEMCHLQRLQLLDLSNNNFFGIIPWCFNNLTTMVNKTSLDKFRDVNPDNVESVDITTKGRTRHYDSILHLVITIDLSMNNLSGNIPKELTSLAELRFLNLSGNHLTGIIPNNIGDMKQLEALDLSRNSLSGEIPNSFTLMSSLNHLNLSYNKKLRGKIPESTQLLGMDPSSFAGTNLCGPPWTRNCSHSPRQTHIVLNNDNKPKVLWLYVFVSLGYAVGLSLACSLLVLKKSWRVTLFRFVEDTWDAIYVYFHIKWKSLQRWLGRNSPMHET